MFFNPLTSANQIAEDYRTYLRSLLSINDEILAAELTERLMKDEAFSKGPFLQSTPNYRKGNSLLDLIEEGILPETFMKFESEQLPLNRKLFTHQEKAMRKARASRNYIVSTGTGSGKTESFLLPIFASLADEIQSKTLSPGIRALLLYPMNALANDQLKRLRQLLAKVPEITFGRYIGDTLKGATEAEQNFNILNPGEVRLKNELLSREEMQESPPHILITNYAMLEYLLLRPADMTLFEGRHGNKWRFIVVDEAHVYDGARGSEMAMLIRRLQRRVIQAQSLQCIATSATVGSDTNPKSVTDFASNLFGQKFEWSEEDETKQDLVKAEFEAGQGTEWSGLHPSDYVELSKADDWRAALKQLLKDDVPSERVLLEDKLVNESSILQVKKLLSDGALDFQELLKEMGNDWDATSLNSLIAFGARVKDSSGTPLLAVKYHLWIRSSEGAFTCLNPERPHVRLSRAELCDQCERPCFEFGACMRCGTVYLVGTEVVQDNKLVFKAKVTNFEEPTWLALTKKVRSDDEDDEIWDEESIAGSSQVLFCGDCGAFSSLGHNVCGKCESNNLRSALRVETHSRNIVGCIACGSKSSGQVRLLDSGSDASAAVLATSLYQALPSEIGEQGEKRGGGRKLLVFSDSRQGAAFFAPYLDTTYQKLIQRRLILESLKDEYDRTSEPVRVGDWVASTIQLATKHGYFNRKATRQEKEREVGLWIAQELIAFDQRQSLEGLGLIKISLVKPEIQIPQGFKDLGLSEGQAMDLFSALIDSVRKQGAITMPFGVDHADEAFKPRLGPIYVRVKKSGSKILSWVPSQGSNRRHDYLSKVLKSLDSDESPTTLLEKLWKFITREDPGWLIDSLHHKVHGVLHQVNHELLEVIPVDRDRLFQCRLCAQISSININNVCNSYRCNGELVEFVKSSQQLNHYERLYSSLLPIPMKVEEHTAQWQAYEASDIQNKFIRGDVNTLSCSTTFELGVDVGELQTVFLRNIPPSTASYVQRAGRAGRRTSSAALVLAFAQRRNHDLSRYSDPKEMISGVVKPPIIPLENDRIDRRHAHSVVIAAFFREMFHRKSLTWSQVGDFFAPLPGEPNAVSLMEEFLISHHEPLHNTLSDLLPNSVAEKIGLENGEWKAFLLNLLKLVAEEVNSEIDYFEAERKRAFEAGRNSDVYGRIIRTLRTRQLIGFFGARNILPKYGFPFDVVELRTSSNAALGAKLDLSRDLSQAIYDYAPGHGIVAGGVIWKSAGIYRLPGRDLVSGRYAECSSCSYFEHSVADLSPQCGECGSNRVIQKYVVPEFGFIAEKNPVKVGGQPPVRSWNGSTYFVKSGDLIDIDSVGNQTKGNLLKLTATERSTLMAVSVGKAKTGFLVCDSCGRGLNPEGRIPPQHDHAWKEEKCKGILRRVMLAHLYETDVLQIELLNQGFITSEKIWSGMYGILESASDLLQISRDDIDGTISFTSGSARIYLFDTVPGGAGCVLRIGASFKSILEHASKRLSYCECSPETSCYACLRNYRNQIRHDQLSRGLSLEFVGQIS